MEKVIADAGPLVAYLKRDDENHDWAEGIFRRLTSPLKTCDAVLSEAFFLLQQIHGGTDKLLVLLERGLVIPNFDLLAEPPHVAQLVRQYESVPMSLADACLVRMAELGRNASIFTLDSDFPIYRKNRRQLIGLIHPD
jgi:predicted nucleic acid-binding protein